MISKMADLDGVTTEEDSSGVGVDAGFVVHEVGVDTKRCLPASEKIGQKRGEKHKEENVTEKDLDGSGCHDGLLDGSLSLQLNRGARLDPDVRRACRKSDNGRNEMR